MISIPERLKNPSNDINPKGRFVVNKPITTPINAKGTVIHIIRVFLIELNNPMMIRTIITKNKGNDSIIGFCASADSLYCPCHST